MRSDGGKEILVSTSVARCMDAANTASVQITCSSPKAVSH